VRLAPAALLSVVLLGVSAGSYGFTVLAARLLAPAAYGELAALMGLLLVGVVPATALQTVAALGLARAGGDSDDVVRRLHGTALTAAAGVGLAGLLAAGPVVALLHLPDPAVVGWLIVLLLPHTVVGVYDGLLQGRERHGLLAVVMAGFGVAKLAGGTIGLVLGGTPAAALAGMAVGATVGALGGWAACGRPGVALRSGASGGRVLRTTGALLGFVVLVNLDVLLARHHLPAAVAGEYAVAALLAKVAFWLPQGVGVTLLPRLADRAEADRALPAALLVVAATGGLLTLGTALLGDGALALVGGRDYGAHLGGVAWCFAAQGTLLAVAQLLLWSGLAGADRWAGAAVWAAVVAEAGVVALLSVAGQDSATAVAVAALATAAVLVLAGLGRRRLSGR
jgi:O-antigen/teichoic acid export membrane protein